MSGRVEEDTEGLSRLVCRFSCTQFEHGRLGGIEAFDHDINVHLLRMSLSGPAGCVVILDLLETDWWPGVRGDFCPGSVLVDPDIPTEELAVELREFTSIGSIENDHGLLCDSHASTLRRQRPSAGGVSRFPGRIYWGLEGENPGNITPMPPEKC